MNPRLKYIILILLLTTVTPIKGDGPIRVMYSESLQTSTYEYSIRYSRLGVAVTGQTPFGVINGSIARLELINSLAGLEYGSPVESSNYRFMVDDVETSVIVDLYELLEFNLTLNIFATLILPTIAEFENGVRTNLFEYSNETGYRYIILPFFHYPELSVVKILSSASIFKVSLFQVFGILIREF